MVDEIRDRTDLNEKAKIDLIEHKCEVLQEMSFVMCYSDIMDKMNLTVRSMRKKSYRNRP